MIIAHELMGEMCGNRKFNLLKGLKAAGKYA